MIGFVGHVGTASRAIAGEKPIEMRLVGMERPFVTVLVVATLLYIIDLRTVVRRCCEHTVSIGYFGREQAEPDAHSSHSVVVLVDKLAIERIPSLVVAAPCDTGQSTNARETHIVEVVGLFGMVRNVGFA